LIAAKFHDDFIKDEIRQKVAGMTPLCREGAVEEIVNTLAYLVSSETFIKTGANIDIHDGLALS
tara:strand:+ start:223 stop:414 length:192 start_codon:yes stop_codon:yes gene_type:complete